LDEEVRYGLDKYAEFLDANASYVVSEGLKFLFRKDEEFKRWLGQHNKAETLPHIRKHDISKGESIQLELK
jgi:predicted transcriptional regulator